MPQLNVNISEEQNDHLQAVKSACERHGIKLNQFVYDGIMEYFTTGKWAKFFKEEK